MRRVVVVGASLAGLRAVEALRAAGYDGSLLLVGAEPHLPYDRPPLSKELLAGDAQPHSSRFRDAAHFDALAVDLCLGRAATGLDLAAREVAVGDRRLPFDGLIVATGARPRQLRADGLDGVHVLRTVDDLVALRDDFASGPQVVIVGAGFIGAEVASSARARGLDVTIVEAAPTPLAHAVGEELGAVCAGLHADHGTRLLCGVGVAGIEGGRRVEAVRLADGTRLAADVVVVGVGVVPATEWLVDSGLPLDDGVVCDAHLDAGHPSVYAAGDVARWQNPLFGVSMRVEHWTNAAEQGGFAARNLLAGSGRQPYSAVPYFWSDQYGARIQAVGRTAGDEVRVLDGSIADRRFVALYRRGDRLVGALGLDSPKLLMQCRSMIARGATWEEVWAGQPSG